MSVANEIKTVPRFLIIGHWCRGPVLWGITEGSGLSEVQVEGVDGLVSAFRCARLGGMLRDDGMDDEGWLGCWFWFRTLWRSTGDPCLVMSPRCEWWFHSSALVVNCCIHESDIAEEVN